MKQIIKYFNIIFTFKNMPRIKSTPVHNEVYVLQSIRKLLSTELIRLIYEYINGRTKLIIDPKLNWYMENIHNPTKSIEFNIKLKIILNNLDMFKIKKFYYSTLMCNPQIYSYCEKEGLEVFNLYRNKELFMDCIVNYIAIRISRYTNYKNHILLPCSSFGDSEEIKQNIEMWKIKEEKENFSKMPDINNTVILCKSILYLYSKYFSAS